MHNSNVLLRGKYFNIWNRNRNIHKWMACLLNWSASLFLQKRCMRSRAACTVLKPCCAPSPFWTPHTGSTWTPPLCWTNSAGRAQYLHRRLGHLATCFSLHVSASQLACWAAWIKGLILLFASSLYSHCASITKELRLQIPPQKVYISSNNTKLWGAFSFASVSNRMCQHLMLGLLVCVYYIS